MHDRYADKTEHKGEYLSSNRLFDTRLAVNADKVESIVPLNVDRRRLL